MRAMTASLCGPEPIVVEEVAAAALPASFRASSEISPGQ